MTVSSDVRRYETKVRHMTDTTRLISVEVITSAFTRNREHATRAFLAASVGYANAARTLLMSKMLPS